MVFLVLTYGRIKWWSDDCRSALNEVLLAMLQVHACLVGCFAVVGCFHVSWASSTTWPSSPLCYLGNVTVGDAAASMQSPRTC